MQLEGLLKRDMLYRGLWRLGWGTRLVLIPCRCSSVASARSTRVRASMPCRGSNVAALNQSRNGATFWVIPMASAFSCIICHAVAGARKWETISRWTRERGPRDNLGTETLSIIGLYWGRWGCPGAWRASKASISAAGGTATSDGVSQSSYTTTVAVRRPRRVSLAKARTFLSSGVGYAKDGVTK